MPIILVVDDSPTIRRMVRTALGSLSDVAFAEAGSGLQAIETLAVQPVQAVVLDLNMPDMHGLDVLKFMRAHRQYRDLPVMILTTPFSPTALATSIQELLHATSRPH
jgi:two-component system chemotaxis response regulator CheY